MHFNFLFLSDFVDYILKKYINEAESINCVCDISEIVEKLATLLYSVKLL